MKHVPVVLMNHERLTKKSGDGDGWECYHCVFSFIVLFFSSNVFFNRIQVYESLLLKTITSIILLL